MRPGATISNQTFLKLTQKEGNQGCVYWNSLRLPVAFISNWPYWMLGRALSTGRVRRALPNKSKRTR